MKGETGCNDTAISVRRFTDKIAVPSPEGLLFITARDIIYCQAQSNYTELFLSDGQKITSSYTLKSFEELLSDQHFFRTHKSFLINLNISTPTARAKAAS